MRGLLYLPVGQKRSLFGLTVIFLAYVLLITYFALGHVFWRDEVRAFTLALQGANIFAMLDGIRNEGHPFLWYALLRIAHDLFPSRLVLPILAWSIAVASAYLVIYRSRFSSFLLILLLLGGGCAYEYAVLARNYGISMLLMFLWAACYSRYRQRGILLGTLLLLLENCNLHSIILAWALMFYWVADVFTEQGFSWQRFRHLSINTVITLLGLVIFLIVVRPTPDNVYVRQNFDIWHGIANGFLHPASAYFPITGARFLGSSGEEGGIYWGGGKEIVLSLLLVGAVFALPRRLARLSGLLALFGMSCVFFIIYASSYRHAALWLVFLITLYWLEGPRDITPENIWCRWSVGLGTCLLVVLLELQVIYTVSVDYERLQGHPESCSAALGQLIETHPALHDAVIISEPGVLIDALPYYTSNPIYILREHRFGKVVRYISSTLGNVSLAQIHAVADTLHQKTGRPVIVLIGYPLDASRPWAQYGDDKWTFTTTREQVISFLADASKVSPFPGKLCSRESYDVYIVQ